MRQGASMWELKRLRERFSSTCSMLNLYGTRFCLGTSCMSCPHLHERVQQVRHFHLRLQTLINREACRIVHHQAGTISPKRIRVREYRNVAPATHGCLGTAFDLSLESQMGSIFSDPDTNDKGTCFKHILESIHQGISKHASRAVVFYRCKALVLLGVHPSCNANSLVKVLIDKSNRRKAIPMQVTTSIGPPSSMRTSRKLLHLQQCIQIGFVTFSKLSS